MPFTTVDTTGFDNAIASFRSALDAYKEARKVLSNNTNNLSSNWEGFGGEKFKTVTQKMMRLLEDDGESLSDIVQNLEEIRRAYQQADTEIASKITST